MTHWRPIGNNSCGCGGDPIPSTKDDHRLKSILLFANFTFPVVPEIPWGCQKDSERHDGPNMVALSSIISSSKTVFHRLKKNKIKLEVDAEAKCSFNESLYLIAIEIVEALGLG